MSQVSLFRSQKFIRMRLDFHPDTLPLYDGKQFLHGSKPHAIADFLMVGIS